MGPLKVEKKNLSLPLLILTPVFSLLPCCHPLTSLSLCFCYSWGTRFHSGHMFRLRHSYSHTHAQTHSYSWACALIVSICCLWCFAAALLLTNWPFHHCPMWQDPSSYPSHRASPNQLHTPHTHTLTMVPSVTKLLLLWPLCDFRASLFNKVL